MTPLDQKLRTSSRLYLALSATSSSPRKYVQRLQQRRRKEDGLCWLCDSIENFRMETNQMVRGLWLVFIPSTNISPGSSSSLMIITIVIRYLDAEGANYICGLDFREQHRPLIVPSKDPNHWICNPLENPPDPESRLFSLIPTARVPRVHTSEAYFANRGQAKQEESKRTQVWLTSGFMHDGQQTTTNFDSSSTYMDDVKIPTR
ncbi:hypothetical protein EV360DRAFT_86980 [Lentinula raphanica]|nr:hypothetical protein EV360DRAFT_86980 [Lentinula raphanica]